MHTKSNLSILVLVVALLSCGGPSAPDVVSQYIDAANRHDFIQLRSLIAGDAVWYLGPDTLAGVDEIMQPLQFDEGASTVLKAANFFVSGDSVTCDLEERSNVLQALGIPALHHFVSMVIRDGKILRIREPRPPIEFRAFADSILAFSTWLRGQDPVYYGRLWPNGKFYYSVRNGEVMPGLILQWKEERGL